MRRLVLILAFLPLLLVPTATHTIMLPVLGGKGPSYSDIIFWSGFEGQAVPGDDNLETSNCNTGTDTTWDRGGTAAVAAASKLSGSYGLDIPANDDATPDQGQITITSGDYFKSPKGAIVCSVYFNTWDNACRIWRILDAAADDDIILTMTADNELLITYDGTATCVTDSADLATGTWYYVVYKWDATANTQTLAIYTTAGALVDSDTDATDVADLADISTDGILRAGAQASQTGDYWLDQVVIFDGSISRTAEEYMNIVRNNATCPR